MAKARVITYTPVRPAVRIQNLSCAASSTPTRRLSSDRLAFDEASLATAARHRDRSSRGGDRHSSCHTTGGGWTSVGRLECTAESRGDAGPQGRRRRLRSAVRRADLGDPRSDYATIPPGAGCGRRGQRLAPRNASFFLEILDQERSCNSGANGLFNYRALIEAKASLLLFLNFADRVIHDSINELALLRGDPVSF